MSLFVRDCGCIRLRWFHDEIGCATRKRDEEYRILQELWGMPEAEEPYDWELHPMDDDE